MGTKWTARFVVQRDGTQYVVRGDQLFDKVKATDLLAVQRGDTLYHAVSSKLHDDDWLVCLDGDTACRISGSEVIPLLLPPPSLEPAIVKIDGVAVTDFDTPIETTAGTEFSLEVEVNSAAKHLPLSYEWGVRSGDGQFTSSSKAKAVVFEVGAVGQLSAVNCVVQAIGAAEPSYSTEAISFFAMS